MANPGAKPQSLLTDAWKRLPDNELPRIRRPFVVSPDREGGYLFYFPDLPNCFGRADTLGTLGRHAFETYINWLATPGNFPPDSLTDDADWDQQVASQRTEGEIA